MNDENTWRIQVSFKTMSGTLINCRAETGMELDSQILYVTGIAGQIAATEQALGAIGAVSQGLPLAPQQPAQPAPQPPQPQGWGPTPAAPLPAYPSPVAPTHPQAAPYGASGAAPTQQPGPVCDCGLPAKLVPGGVSRRTQKPYRAFYSCPQDRCKFSANA